MVIPEGDWYCPDCQHSGLIEGLEDKLKSYAALYKSKEGEIKRRERLAFVSMSLQNIIPSSRDKFHPAKANPKATEKKSAPARKPRRKRSDDEDSSSGTYLDLSIQILLKTCFLFSYLYQNSLSFGFKCYFLFS